MKIIIPNPFGHEQLTAERVARAKEKVGFSDGFAQFLLIQNGLNFQKMLSGRSAKRYLEPADGDGENASDLRYLYGLDTGNEWDDLEINNAQSFYAPYFVSIGSGYGGNDYIEVRRGKFKGLIGSVDHEVCGSSLEDLVDGFDLDDFFEKDLDAQCDQILSEATGLVWPHAWSITEFTRDCLRAADGNGYVEDAASVADLKEWM